MNLSDLKEDLNIQKDGSVYELSGMKFYVRRAGTKEYNRISAEIKNNICGPWKQDSHISDYDNAKIMSEMLSEYLVVKWEGVFEDDDSDKELEYSKRNARMLFSNEEYFLSLNLLIMGHATNYSNYLHKKVEEDIDAAKKP